MNDSTSTLGNFPVSSTAELQTINFAKLASYDSNEISRLTDICIVDGFFYLDLRDWKDGQLVRDLNTANGVVEKWFKKPIEEKTKTITLSDAHGYKRVGQQSGVHEGQRDGYESLRLSRTAQTTRTSLPEIVENQLPLFDGLHFGSHHILKTILSCLSIGGKEQAGNYIDFEATHKDEMRSRSGLYFMHHPPKPADTGCLGQNIHTDAGTLTLLFTQQWGLQVVSPETGEWKYVVSRLGHGIVNIGDTLRFLSRRRFRSALHRVLPLTDEEGTQLYDRYSTAYFLRAADEATFCANDGIETTAEDWFLRKFHSFTEDRVVQRADSVAFGGIEKVLGIEV